MTVSPRSIAVIGRSGQLAGLNFDVAYGLGDSAPAAHLSDERIAA